MLDILKKFDSVQSKNTALNEDVRAVTLECGGVAEDSAMQSPITLNITMSSADQMAQLMRALSMINGGNDQVDGLKTNGTPVDDPSIPGRDDVKGDTDLNQGAFGALAGGALGTGLGLATGAGPMATTLGALSGAAAGDSLTDRDEDDPRIPGRDDVEGDTDLQASKALKAGALGTAIGGIAGMTAGGPAGAALGALAGGAGMAMAGRQQDKRDKTQSQVDAIAKKINAGNGDNPRIPGRDDVEGDTDLQADISGLATGTLDALKGFGAQAADAVAQGSQAAGDAIATGAKAAGDAVANTDLGQRAIGAMGQASDWAADKGATLGAKAGGAVVDLVGPDRIRSLAGLPADTPDWAVSAGTGLKGMEIGANIGKVAPAAAAAGAGLAGASMLGGDNDDKQESSGDFEKSTTEPDEKYWDHDTMVNKLSGGLNRKKKMYKPASQGDNAMAIESMKARLLKALGEASKKAKPDFLDMDKDGNKKEPMKKAVADKKGDAPKKGKVPPQFQKNVKEAVNETADLNRMKQFLKRLNG